MKKDLPDDEKIHDMHAGLCKMLSHPTRLKILKQLEEEKKTVNEIAEIVETSQPTTSQHLGELKKRGLVKAERNGNNTFYSITYPKILDACEIIREVLFEQLK